MPACRHRLTRAATICAPIPLFRIFREDHEILDITVRNSVRNDPSHANSPAGFILRRDRKSKTPPDKMPEIFGPVLLFPPPRRPVKGGYLFLVP